MAAQSPSWQLAAGGVCVLMVSSLSIAAAFTTSGGWMTAFTAQQAATGGASHSFGANGGASSSISNGRTSSTSSVARPAGGKVWSLSSRAQAAAAGGGGGGPSQRGGGAAAATTTCFACGGSGSGGRRSGSSRYTRPRNQEPSLHELLGSSSSSSSGSRGRSENKGWRSRGSSVVLSSHNSRNGQDGDNKEGGGSGKGRKVRPRGAGEKGRVSRLSATRVPSTVSTAPAALTEKESSSSGSSRGGDPTGSTLMSRGGVVPIAPVNIMPSQDLTALLEDEDDDELWSGNKDGFDWQLEQARRAMPAFSPFRMDFWSPDKLAPDEIPEVHWSDTVKILVLNVLQMFLGFPSADGAPVAKIAPYEGNWLEFLVKVSNGRLEDLAGGPLFLLLERYFHEEGPVYKLAFGPRSFIVVSDPVMAKHILKSNVAAYDKGVLAAILEPVMGKGLIPADPATWKIRRRAIVPGFHKRWLNRMMRLFAECNDKLLRELESASETGQVLDMEEKFGSVSLDIIGAAVFNYEFESVKKESPVIKSVYRVLRESEHRSSSFIPYWKLPFADKWIESQREFKADMALLNNVLDKLIQQALDTQQQASVEELEQRDLETMADPSLLRFLIDMRGEDTTSSQLRDDLMTMLIAGHETTAAVLTWSLFNLIQSPDMAKMIRDEIKEVLGDSRLPTYDDLPRLKLTRLALVEALRLYPEPPVLIRRALKEDVLPAGGAAQGVRLLKGADVFISSWNLHRSPQLWKDPAVYNPLRFLEPHDNPAVKDWAGYRPAMAQGLYPNEVATDFAFVPFGGGTRKCVGDQFAMMEATVVLATILRDYDFELTTTPEEVGMVTGATIHTENGLKVRAKRRQHGKSSPVLATAEKHSHAHTHHDPLQAESIKGVEVEGVKAGAMGSGGDVSGGVGPVGEGAVGIDIDIEAAMGEGEGKGKCPFH